MCFISNTLNNKFNVKVEYASLDRKLTRMYIEENLCNCRTNNKNKIAFVYGFIKKLLIV